MDIPRRDFIAASAALLCAPAIHTAARAVPNLGSPFVLGVASGDPARHGVTLWTRLATLPLDPRDAAITLPDVVPVLWEVAEDDAMRRIVRRGTARAQRGAGHSVHVDVAGLRAGRSYWYRFTALGAQSAIGHSITLPAPGSQIDRLRMAVASCAHYERGWFSAYRHLAAEWPDLVLFLGDYIYEYSLARRDPAAMVRSYEAEEATDLAGYRHRYAVHRSDPDLQAAHGIAPWISIWDDHEVQDDYSGRFSSHPEISTAVFRRRRAAAYRAWWENMPVRAAGHPHGDHARIYRSYGYGSLANIVTLDGRQYRSRQPCADRPPFGKGHMEAAGCADLADPQRTMLGAAQERWLDRALAVSGARWTFLAQDLMVAPLRAPGAPQDLYWTDTWDGFQAPRQQLIETITRRRPANPVILSGDYHSFVLSDIHRNPLDPASERVAAEILGTSITSSGPGYDTVRKVLPANPHIRFFDSRERGYTRLDVTPTATEVMLRTISDRRDPDATVATLARFAVEAGRPGIVTA